MTDARISSFYSRVAQKYHPYPIPSARRPERLYACEDPDLLFFTMLDQRLIFLVEQFYAFVLVVSISSALQQHIQLVHPTTLAR